ncbi:MAG: hypothetical protein N3J91_01740 [Verrucomicrobiae bacterium]|nr:hypothetical protein [Verrucomicrobiae bacterium]
MSQANNLVTNDDRGPHLDVFVRDPQTRQTTLVSVSTNGWGGANQDANYPTLSADGWAVVFASAASNLTPGDTNGYSDIFLRDLRQGVTRLISVAEDGIQGGNGDSTLPCWSVDGRWVVFASRATNLVTADYAGSHYQIFARDLQEGRTVLVSIGENGGPPASGPCEAPGISADGRWVVFVSQATNLVAGATNAQGEIYVRDVTLQQTHWVSSNAAACFATSTNVFRCFNPVISRDGSMVAFKAAPTNAAGALLFCHELATGTTWLISSNTPLEAWPELSSDGRWLAYVDSQIRAPYDATSTHLKIWDRSLQSSRYVEISHSGQTNYLAVYSPVFSADQQFAAFLVAPRPPTVGLNPNDLRVCQIYIANLSQLESRLLTVGRNGQPSPGLSADNAPVISPDGQWVAFDSVSDALVAGDANGASDVFLCDALTGRLELVSLRHEDKPQLTATAQCYIEPQGISANGRYVMFSSFASSLSPQHTNFHRAVYLMDLHTGTNNLVIPPWNAATNNNPYPLRLPVISPDGRRIAMLGRVAIDGGSVSAGAGAPDGWLYDAKFDTYKQLNVNPTGGVVSACFPLGDYVFEADQGVNMWWRMAFSPDGNTLAFTAKNLELVGQSGTQYYDIYLFDLFAQTARLLTQPGVGSLPGGGNNHSMRPQFSPDGRWLVFSTRATDLMLTNDIAAPTYKLYAWDFHLAQYRRINSFGTNIFIGPDSRFVVYNSLPASQPSSVYLHNLYETPIYSYLIFAGGQKPVLSSNAEVIAFQTQPTNGLTHIFATNRVSRTLQLVSVAPDGVTPGNGPSGPPQITPNGRYVLFDSKANNLVSHDFNQYSDVFLRDLQLGVTYLLSANPRTGRAGNGPSTQPLLSADGGTIVFASHASDLVQGDYNAMQDIFVVRLAGGDTDGDGLDDAWELAYLNTLMFNGNDDCDGDTLTNAQEQRAGTDPTNRGSVLRALVMGMPGGGSTTLLWPAAAGRTYKVQYKASLNDPAWTDLEVAIEITGNTARAVDTGAGLSAQRFYRIVIP